MNASRLALAIGADDPARLAAFWAALLRRTARMHGDGVLLPGEDGQLDLRIFPCDLPQARPNRVHLHLTSTDSDDQQRLVAEALSLGAEHLDIGQLPEEEHVVLADPEGYEFCVIEPGNAFLAGCGLLGELACDGTRTVGHFWTQAMGWPLVWDENEETAIQSPQGGTKVAWGGPPITPRPARSRQRFEIATGSDDLDADVARLIALGASLQGVTPDGATLLADPDGIEFSVRRTSAEPVRR